MSSLNNNSPRSYLDFSGLGQLRGQAAQDQRQAVRATAEQFEVHFVQEMLKSMRATVEKSELSESSATDTYQDMMDKEVSMHVVRNGGMGVADMIERQLLQRMDSPAADVLQNRSATHLPLKPAEAGLALPDTGAAKHAVPRPIKAYGLDGLGANHPNFRKLP